MKVVRTLIVEDNRFFREILKETLHSRFPSMEIDEAKNGEEALEKVKALPPNFVFMDIQLPGENGLKTTEKIKAQYPDIVVNILTNYDIPEYREAAYQCKANHFIPKTSFLEMVDTVSAHLSREEKESDKS